MHKFKIAIIKQNNLSFTDSDIINDQLNKLCSSNYDITTINKINSDIETMITPFITLKEVTLDEMMEEIVKNTLLTPELMGDTSLCMEYDKDIYQLCHLSLKNNRLEEDDNNINGIGSCLALDHEKVYGKAVLIKSTITDDYTCQPSSINLIEDISNIIFKKIIHKGIKIKDDASIEEFFFKKDPAENFSEADKENYKWFELSLFKFNLIVFIESAPTFNNINKIATRIMGKKVVGNMIIVSSCADNDYEDFDRQLFDKLDTSCWGSLESRKSYNDENENENKKINGLPIVKNRYISLNERYNRSRNLFDGYSYTCTGCFRIKYASSDEQKNDWASHKTECSYNQDPINNLLKK